MPGSRAYDVMYRAGLARMFWSRIDRPEIRGLVEGGPCDPRSLAPASGGPSRAIDLGCGEGGVSIYLARQGFDTVGVDFSGAALGLARRAATRAGLDADRRSLHESPELVAGPYTMIATIPGSGKERC